MSEKHNIYLRQLRRTRIKNNLCTECGAPVVAGFKMCQKHRELFMSRCSVRRATHKSSGLCPYCGNPVIPLGSYRCFKCANRVKLWMITKRRNDPSYYHRKWIKKRDRCKEKNLCQKCGAPLRDDYVRVCVNCRIARVEGPMINRRIKEYEVITKTVA